MCSKNFIETSFYKVKLLVSDEHLYDDKSTKKQFCYEAWTPNKNEILKK